jgi:predicted permease
MSFWSRIHNALRPDRLSRDIDEEFESHIEDAIAQGRDPSEARRAFGSAMRQREESRDARVIRWLDSLRADTIFGWRQLMKRKVSSAAAILSLGLATGACTSAFRLIDALLLRPLPVSDPQQLYSLSREGAGFDGKPSSFDGWAYPSFQRMRADVKGKAELIAISYSNRVDLTYGSDREMEKANIEYVSGWMFPAFGLNPSQGRLLTEEDDNKPGAHPYAVLSYDYWSRRFGRDPNVIGKTFRLSDGIFEIVGVGPERFTGTETGIVTDLFVPTMMHPAAVRDDATWHRTLAKVKSGVAIEPLRQQLNAASRAFEQQRAKGFTGMTKQSIDRFINQKLVLEPAAAGASGLQKDYRRSLVALGILVVLVLLIACVNIANLMSVQAASRAREMALRVSIGAGRRRLVQLVLIESALLALMASALAALFAWWSAPFVVSRINPPDNPARLYLPADGRVLVFGFLLTAAATILFGLAPALRASSVRPANALKGGEDPHTRSRSTHILIAVQVAFCFLVLFVAGLFAATFERLASKPLGFSPERLLTLDTVVQRPQPAPAWEQVADQLRTVPGIETVAYSKWPLLGNQAMNSFISVAGAPPGPVLAYFLNISPQWLTAMKIRLLDGRDFRPGEITPAGSPTLGAAIVNETFAKQFFSGVNPVGKTFARGRNAYQIVGLVSDTPYRTLRESILPTAYTPFRIQDADGAFAPVRDATFVIRIAFDNPKARAAILARKVSEARPGFRVSNNRTQMDLVRAQTTKERLLAALAVFFAGVALLLAGVGLYGVIDYSVLQRRREIGIRIAIGAKAAGIARLVTIRVFVAVLGGAGAGLVLAFSAARYLESVLYQVKPTELTMLAIPLAGILATALVAACWPVLRAVRIDPVTMLRSE